MKVGLFFGSFNPIHNGHLIIGQYMLDQAKLDEVWYIVSPQNPLKKGKDIMDADHRLNMVKLAIADARSLSGFSMLAGQKSITRLF